MIDYIVRRVDGVGFLPITEVDGKEVYRGEYQDSPFGALDKCIVRQLKETSEKINSELNKVE